MSKETITIEVPTHLKKWFVGVFAACCEQTMMEAYPDSEEARADFIGFDYPFFNTPDPEADIKVIEYKD